MQPNEAQPFATIESSLEFVHLLRAAIAETVADVHQDVSEAQQGTDQRRCEALQLVHYKLHQLSFHIGKSERLLRDLGRLRTLILTEIKPVETQPETKPTGYAAASANR